MRLFLILISNIFITRVHGFFYTLLPVVILKHNIVKQQNKVTDTELRAYCPWNLSNDEKLVCKIHKDVIGYTYKDDTSETTPGVTKPYKFINPTLQKWFTEDNCAKIKQEWTTNNTKENSCKNYSYCFNFSNDKSLCTCQSGFFGDPYTGCKQHCFSDDDCTSPFATCGTTQSNPKALTRCVCKQGYQGDGVMCHTNPCGDDRLKKCEGQRICVPTGPGNNDYKCVCPSGHFINHKNTCVEEFTATKDTIVTLIGKNVEDGSRIEVGDCFSFILNDGNKSVFFHKNSGDSVYVKKPINNPDQFSLFYILTDEVALFSSVKETKFGLTKLYSLSNTFLNCRFGHVKIFDPAGHEVSDEEVFNRLYPKSVLSTTQSTENNSGSTPAPASGSAGASTSSGASTLQTGSKVSSPAPAKPDATNSEQNPKKPEEKVVKPKVKPVVEVYVRQLTEGEKSGGLSGFNIPSSMLQPTSEEPAKGPGSQSTVEASESPGSPSQSTTTETPASQLQTGVSTSQGKAEL